MIRLTAGCSAIAIAVTAFSSPALAQAGPEAGRSGQPAQASGSDVVVVYGDRLSTDPGAYSVVGSDTIGEIAANHPAEILNTVPGVNVQMNSGQELLIAIRSPVLPAGAGQGSFLILENGIPTRRPDLVTSTHSLRSITKPLKPSRSSGGPDQFATDQTLFTGL